MVNDMPATPVTAASPLPHLVVIEDISVPFANHGRWCEPVLDRYIGPALDMAKGGHNVMVVIGAFGQPVLHSRRPDFRQVWEAWLTHYRKKGLKLWAHIMFIDDAGYRSELFNNPTGGLTDHDRVRLNVCLYGSEFRKLYPSDEIAWQRILSSHQDGFIVYDWEDQLPGQLSEHFRLGHVRVTAPYDHRVPEFALVTSGKESGSSTKLLRIRRASMSP